MTETEKFTEATKTLIDSALKINEENIVEDMNNFVSSTIELLKTKEITDEELIEACKPFAKRHNSSVGLVLHVLASHIMIEDELNKELTERLLKLSIKNNDFKAYTELSILYLIDRQVEKGHKIAKKGKKQRLEFCEKIVKMLETSNCTTDDSQVAQAVSEDFEKWRLEIMKRDVLNPADASKYL